MNVKPRPAWARDSIAVRLDRPVAPQDLTPAWAFDGATGAGVRVAVIDSGIDCDHPALGRCVDRESSIDFSVGVDGEVVATVGPHDDVFGHGTAVAGIIHAIAPEATITSVRVLGPRLSGKAAAFHAGLAWAVDAGFDIVNLSLGTTRSEWALAFHEVCDRAYFGNTFIVTAANNVQRASYPSLFASVASVACNTSTDPLRFHANPHPPTEFLARGIDVEVPWIDGGMTTITGNSFAAPHIAALAALIKSKHPELRPFHLKSALWATSANVRESSAIEPAGRRTTMFVGDLGGGTHSASVGEGPSGYRIVGPGVPTRWGNRWPGTRTTDGREVSIHQLDPVDRDPASAATELRSAVARAAGIGSPEIAEVAEVVDRPWLGIVSEPRPVVTRDGGAMVVEEVLDALRRVGTLLAAAHDVGLIHGDLSYDSVIVEPDRIRVHDFGLVAALGAPSPTAAAALDPRFLGHVAPEVLAGKPATEASDVYALGALGRRWLTGSPAYAEEAALGRYLRDRLTTDAIPVDDCTTGIPDGLADLIDAMMARNADDRPSSVAEVVRIVEDLASQPPDGSMDAAGRPVARRWRLGRRNS